MDVETPVDLAPAGAALFEAIAADYDLDANQFAQLHEACRAKDRCDELDVMIRAGEWTKLNKANDTANLMKQLLAALRLPDKKTGKRPQHRGGARGTYKASGGVSNVSALERARNASAS